MWIEELLEHDRHISIHFRDIQKTDASGSIRPSASTAGLNTRLKSSKLIILKWPTTNILHHIVLMNDRHALKCGQKICITATVLFHLNEIQQTDFNFMD